MATPLEHLRVARILRASDPLAGNTLPSPPTSSPIISRLSLRLRVGPRVAWALIAILVAGGLLAVPPVRAVLDDVASNFGDYFAGDGTDDTPGRELSPAELQSSPGPPQWLTADDVSDQRVIASKDGHALYVTRRDDGFIEFKMDGALGLGDTPDGWSKLFADQSIIVLAPLPDRDNGPTALFGLTAGDVASVEVRYHDGGTVKADSSTGGFIALVNPDREPVGIAALDADSNVIRTRDLTYISWGTF